MMRLFYLGQESTIQRKEAILIFSQQASFELSRKIPRDFFKLCEEKIAEIHLIGPWSIFFHLP